MKWLFVAALISGCSPPGPYCAGITAETRLSSLPATELVASDGRGNTWAFEALYLFDERGLSAQCNGGIGNCSAAIEGLRFGVLPKPYSSDCGNGGFGMCHVIVDMNDRIVATTYRCQD